MKTYYLHVIGCQQNEHDGVRIHHLLDKIGFQETTKEKADLIIIVACAVRQTAVDRVFGLVNNIRKAQKNKNPKIIVTGCVIDNDKKKFKARQVDFWDIEKPEQLAKLIDFKDQKSLSKLLREGALFSSSVPIMFGCNNFCTYCATAFTRGRERSRNIKDVISDIKKLIERGNSEILLLGETIDSYKDPETGETLDILFEKLNALDGDFIISFTSNHPKDMTDEIIKAVATLPKIKKEIHLPIQSGSDKILKAMNRPYDAKTYLKIVEKIRTSKVPIDITTDVIVGFPGEDEDDFQKTVEIFKSVGYKTAYINKYSPRYGTAAYRLGDPIPWSEKQRRWRILNDIITGK
ncbi:MAG: (Dimethylallyl)adenosine tRNA methylthiotransferase MiaB [candidate division WS2 bacterium ADurb.Bin280]|uniref:(Dimethylallyl)adenosine tRNA methylthiotransferase MiaB n=1 Tax=candidate division WS2 bacterium ADurb.Bin280 TaxID=1852829 RepID=A0A1V5SH02_9BACT|nr:MAG: (Dimethylallyl)adenosine tRNA methylthiotransferase MiaB [candidate division WS2 bacterium ADurb.Bin280]